MIIEKCYGEAIDIKKNLKENLVKFYNSLGPNPRMVRMFMLEKEIEMPFIETDLMGMANRKPPYLDKNPGGQMPALELDDGTVIGETVNICEYLEELHPSPVLVGTTPKERANHRQWQRRVELNITENMYNGFRYGAGIDMFKDRMRVIPEAAAGLTTLVQEKLAWLDEQMAGKDYICGNEMRMVDLILYCGMDFGTGVGQSISGDLSNLTPWFSRMESRPSAEGSKHPSTAEVGLRGI